MALICRLDIFHAGVFLPGADRRRDAPAKNP